jgi:hypothetical protein
MMRRWFWIIALGLGAFVFAGLGFGVMAWAAWDHEHTIEPYLGGIVMIGFAAQSLSLCFRRVDGPLPEVEPVDPSIFASPYDQ